MPTVFQHKILNMYSKSSPNVYKHRLIHKTHQTLSNNRLQSKKSHTITHNFWGLLRKIAHPLHAGPTNQLISFLNLRKCQEQTSCHYIPSIENMISQQNIEGEDNSLSKSSIEHGFSQDISSQSTFEMRVLYVCLLERIMKQLQHSMSVSQRRKIIRGTWNIFIKYCKDFNYQIFANIGSNIQWGLLQLINFDFSMTPKQKFNAQRKLIEKRINESQHSVFFS